MIPCVLMSFSSLSLMQGCKHVYSSEAEQDKSTYFIQCDPTETALNIKQKVHLLIDHPASDQRLILLSTNNVLDDSKTLAD